MRIAQISDFHFTHLSWNPFRLFSKRFLGNLNWFFKRKNQFSALQLDPLPALFNELGVDLVLLGGDFTTSALKKEYEIAGSFIQKIEQPWIAIPGNHDHYTWASFRNKDFYRYFTNLKKEIAHKVDFFTLKDQGVEAHRVGPNLWVVALDTARATNLYSSQGLFSEKTEANLREVLQLIPETDSILLLNHYPFFQNDDPRRNLKRGEALEKLLKKERRIRLYLHGHTHRQVIADLQPSDLPLILDSGSCAYGERGAWNLIDLTKAGCSVTPYRWDQQWTKIGTEEFVWTRQ